MLRLNNPNYEPVFEIFDHSQQISYPGQQAVADCHSRMLLSGIHCHTGIDSRLKHAGMTDFKTPKANLQQPASQDAMPF